MILFRFGSGSSTLRIKFENRFRASNRFMSIFYSVHLNSPVKMRLRNHVASFCSLHWFSTEKGRNIQRELSFFPNRFVVNRLPLVLF